MRSLRAHIRAAVFGQLIVLSSLATGQSASTLSLSKLDQPFSAIQTSLAIAADSALNAAQVEEPAPNPSKARPESIAIKAFDPERNLHTKSGRLESLRPIVQSILARESVPETLAAVILVESAGNPLALSPKGARGLWQLMPNTARRYGLRVDSSTDDRIDVEKSTTAAAKYLRGLYVQFGSWPLALAAYNAGEQSLQRAINRAGSNEFTTLSFLRYIPDETRNYVPAVLAAMGTPSLKGAESTPTVKPGTFVYAFSAARDTHDPSF